MLVPCTALLLYMVKESYNPDFAKYSRVGAFNDLDPWMRATFFGACAAICAACLGVVCWRLIWPRTETQLSGITSKLFWGPGALAWPAIEKLAFQGNFMFVHGLDATRKKKKLIVNLSELDCPSGTVLFAIYMRRPDVLPAETRQAIEKALRTAS